MAKFNEEASLDIVHDILGRLPAKFLLRLRCVCKAWKNIIDDQLFVKSHTKKQQQSSSSSTVLIRINHREEGGGGKLFCLSLDTLISRLSSTISSTILIRDGGNLLLISRQPKLLWPRRDPYVIPLEQIILPGVPPETDAVPRLSCNGLILIPHHNIKESWAIWNPLLQHLHLLKPPPPPLETTDLKKSNKYGRSALERCGFGYDEGSDDYKVVRVDRFNNGDKGYYYITRVYSLKLCSWRTIDDFPGGDCLGDRGAFLDGALYWISRDGLVALNLGTEVHRLMAPPPPSSNINNKERWLGSLDALDGCLIWSCFDENVSGLEAWVMEEDYSWRELCLYGSRMKIVGYSKSKRKVFFSHGRGTLSWLDLENQSWSDDISYLVSRLFCSNSIRTPTFSLSFTQISPLSLVRLDNHYKNENTSGVKRKRKRKWEKP